HFLSTTITRRGHQRGCEDKVQRPLVLFSLSARLRFRTAASTPLSPDSSSGGHAKESGPFCVLSPGWHTLALARFNIIAYKVKSSSLIAKALSRAWSERPSNAAWGFVLLSGS